MWPTEKPTTDATTFTTSLQKSKFQPFILPAFRPGKAKSIITPEIPSPIAEINAPLKLTPVAAPGEEKAEGIPNAPNPTKTNKTPKIPAIQGIQTTRPFTAVAGSGGKDLNKPSREETIELLLDLSN